MMWKTACRSLGVFATVLALGSPTAADEPPRAINEVLGEAFLRQRAELDLTAAELDLAAKELTSRYFAIHAGSDNPFGAVLSPADDSLRAQLDLPAKQGLVVARVTAGGPAAQVGLQSADVLLSLAGADLDKPETLAEALKAVGEKPAVLHVIRGGKPLEIRVKPVYRVTFGPAAPAPRPYYIGVQIDTPDDTLRAHLKDLPAGQGLVASEVLNDSPALKAGIKRFDLLLECNGKPLAGPDDLVGQVQGSAGKPLTFKLLRAGKPLTLTVTPTVRPDAPDAQAKAETLLLYLADRAHQKAPQPVKVLTRPVNTVDYVFDAANAQAPSAIDQRLDAIAAELANLHKALDALQKALQARSAHGAKEK